jgi:hypothetical protein
MNPQTATKLAALIAALAAITIEDVTEIKNAGVLGPDAVQNMTDLQQHTLSIDQETLDVWNSGRASAGLPPV